MAQKAGVRQSSSYDKGPPPSLPVRVRLTPPARLGTFRPRIPPSKYVANRALLLAALAEGTSLLRGLPENDDLGRALAFVEALGARPEKVAADSWVVRGVGGRPRFPAGTRIDLGASGTLARFALAVAALSDAPVVLDGSPRLRERPMDELLEALVALGARVESTGGGLPVRISGPLAGGAVRLSGRTSSQFASALLLVGPLTPRGIRLGFHAPPVSASYIELTREAMEAFGVRVVRDGNGLVTATAGAGYRSSSFVVPPDPTALGYFAALTALAPGSCLEAEGAFVRPFSGEARLLDCLETMGAHVETGEGILSVRGDAEPLRPLGRVDAGSCPDSVPTLAVLAATAPGESVLTGIGHLRHKESDRPAALALELARLGLDIEARDEELCILGRSLLRTRSPVFESHDDHRLAMSLALLTLRLGAVEIVGAEAVAKSFPGYWNELAALGFGVEETP